jgi:hypothetical protein
MCMICYISVTVTLNMDPQSGQNSCCWVEEDNITSIQLNSSLSSDHSVMMCCSCMLDLTVTHLADIHFLQRVQCLVHKSCTSPYHKLQNMELQKYLSYVNQLAYN